MKISVTLRRATPTLNEWERTHYQARARMKAAFAKEIFASYLMSGGVKEFDAMRMMTETIPKMKIIIRSFRRRLIDYDNLVGGAKPLLDALTRVRFIRDDSPKWIEAEYLQTVIGPMEAEFTIIELEDIEKRGEGPRNFKTGGSE